LATTQANPLLRLASCLVNVQLDYGTHAVIRPPVFSRL
jgi:hypothetical protein